MKRREFLTAFGTAIAASSGTLAQTPSKVFHFGTLTPGMPIGEKSTGGATLLRVLGERGFRLGENLTYDARGAARQLELLPQILQEMRGKGIEVLVVLGYPTAVAAKSAGIPTVIAYGAGDPVATGIVKSLADPGGTITGISDDAATLTTKRLSLLKHLLPSLRRVAMIWDADDFGMKLRYEASAKAAQLLDIIVQSLSVRELKDFDGIFAALDNDRPDAILMVSNSLTDSNRNRVFDYAVAKRLPAIYESDPLAHDGGLMSYGGDPKESFERAADLAARIFKGARPANLPFERPTRYPFVINLKTAKAMNLEIPPSLVALADRVIE